MFQRRTLLVVLAGGVLLTACGSSEPATKVDDKGASAEWTVGEDIVAGDWRNSVPAGVPKCAWYVADKAGKVTQSGGTGEDRVANGLTAGQVLSSVGCGTWVVA